MFRFAYPAYFLLLIPLAVAVWRVYRRRIRQGIVFSSASHLPLSGTTWRTMAARMLPALSLLGIAFAIAALARPQTVFSKSRRTADVIAIEMVVDASGTMEALDMSERLMTGDIKERTRLDAVKEAFASFIEKRPDDLIGLITFGGFATSRSPLTADHEALLHILKGVQVIKTGLDADGQMVNQEETLTAIGDALATACGRLEHAGAKSRIVVLLTDGLSNTGIIKPEDAMKAAKKLGIKVYTIGVGTVGSVAPIRVRDQFGREVIARLDVSMDEELLRNIAKTTGGQYFNVRDPKGLDRAMEAINRLEKTKVEQDIYNQYHELFPWLLLPGLCLVVLGTGFNMLAAKRIL
jgi:Ca-activated chloride channel family protein